MSSEARAVLSVAPNILKAIADAVNGLEFGEVHITVHDGRIVRIERTEKIRIDQPVREHALGKS